MKAINLVLATLSLTASPAVAFDVIAGCAVSQPPSGRVFYVNPVSGSDSYAGTQAAPWKSVHSVGMKPGDTELLMTGNYGDVLINRVQNAGFVTIKAALNNKPILSSLTMMGSANWIVQGLWFRGLASAYDPFVMVSGSSNTGGHDIIITGNNFSSQDNVSAWSQKDWLAKARWEAIDVDGGDVNSSRMKCVSVINNAIKNLRLGIAAFADDMVVSGNTVDNFSSDGIDFAGNNLVISKNKITNSVDIGDGTHPDAMQGQPGNGNPGVTVFNNILIDGNTVIAKTRPNLKFPNELQGITAFDMDWSNVSIINNVVVTNNYHGLSFYSLHNGLIANNAVMGINPDALSWLEVADKSHQGSSSDHVIVRNNIVSSLLFDTTGPTVTADHNVVAKNITWPIKGVTQWLSAPGPYGDHNKIDTGALASFQDFDIPNAIYNLHLLAGSSPKGTGALPAPDKSTGAKRLAPVDPGAY